MLHLTKDEVIDLLAKGWDDDHPSSRHIAECAECAAVADDAFARAELFREAELRGADGLGPVVLNPLPADAPGPFTAGRLSAREEDILRRLASPVPLLLLEREWPDLECGFRAALRALERRIRLEHPVLLVEARRALGGALGEWSFVDAADSEPEPNDAGTRVVELSYPIGVRAKTFDAGGGARSALDIDTRRDDGLVGVRLLHLVAATLRMTGSRACEEALLARRYGAWTVGLQRLIYSDDDDEHWGAVLERLLPARRVELRYGERATVPRDLLPVEENGEIRCALEIELGHVSQPVRTTTRVVASKVSRAAASRTLVAEARSPDGDLFVARAFLVDSEVEWEVTSADFLLSGRRLRLRVTTPPRTEELELRLDQRGDKAYAVRRERMELPILSVEIEELIDP
jgi:hypothetical protein